MTEGQKQVTARKLKALAKMMSTPDLIEACRANDRHQVPTGLSRAQYSEAVDRLERYSTALRAILGIVKDYDEELWDELQAAQIEGAEDED